MSDDEKPQRRNANDNPWYCLATLYGEQPERRRDNVLADKNRNAWNRWMARLLNEGQRVELIRKGYRKHELAPLDQDTKPRFEDAWHKRTGGNRELTLDPLDSADFTKTNFSRGVSFQGFIFPSGADFNASTFSEAADFNFARFSGIADFHSTTFSGDADFQLAAFSSLAHFGMASFSSIADFRSATFSSITAFASATFSNYSHFDSATFSGDAVFASAKFSGRADFINTTFAAKTLFEGVRFVTEVPDFRGAKMHPATEWHGVNWPPPPRDKEAAQRQVYAYERLKQEMEWLKKHEDEQFFFRKELRAKRGTMKSWTGTWLLNWAYEVTSDYGYSIGWPLFWLYEVIAVGVFVLWSLPLFKESHMDFFSAAALSAINVFSFLPIRREVMSTVAFQDLSAAAYVVGAVQSVLGILLLFLLGLALRNRFRMK